MSERLSTQHSTGQKCKYSQNEILEKVLRAGTLEMLTVSAFVKK